MSEKTILWVCGQWIADDGKGGRVWELGGIFSSEVAAVAACRTATYFVGPAELDKAFPHDRTPWPGVYYPERERD